MSNPEIRNWASVILASLLACGGALVDSFFFHQWGANTDLVIFMGGLGALGLHTTAVVSTNAIAKKINSDSGG